MILPNMMIIGAQKCGTTWLHRVLDKSEHFWGSDKKELNFWNFRKKKRNIEEYSAHFQPRPETTRYIYECTPHYFRLPKKNVDTAHEIREGLGDIPLVLLLRDPVERYLSAYTHHMMQGRLPHVEKIDQVREDFAMVALGDYLPILEHYQKHFSDIRIFLYDEIEADPMNVVKRVFEQFDVPLDLSEEEILFRTNDKTKKLERIREEGVEFPKALPVLTDQVKQELRDRYSDNVARLGEAIDMDLQAWLS